MDLNTGQARQQVFRIFNRWHHHLFSIPYTEISILEQSALSIDPLVHLLLDKDAAQVKEIRSSIPDYVTTALFAWGRVAPKDPHALVKAEAMVDKFQRHANDTSVGIPIVACEAVWSAMVYCCAQAENDPKAPDRARYWMDLILANPDMSLQLTTFNAVLRAYARRGNAVEVARLVDSTNAVEPNAYTYESLVQAWSLSNHPDGPVMAHEALQKGVRASLQQSDLALLSQLFSRYLNLNRSDPVRSAEVLNQMIHLQEEYTDVRILHSRHFISAMASLARKGNSEQVKDLFRAMEDCHRKGILRTKPSYQALCVVLSSMTKQNDSSLEQAVKLLEMMETELFPLQPHLVTNHGHNVILDAFSRTRQVANKSEKIRTTMDRMRELSATLGNFDLLPDRVSYAALCRALIEEDPQNCFPELEGIVRLMEQSSDPKLQPDKVVYSLLLDAMGKSRDRSALSEALRVKDRICHRFEQGQSNVRMDTVMYTLLMKLHSKAGDVRGSDEMMSCMVGEYEAGHSGCRPNERAFLTAMGTWERSGRPDAFDGALRLFNTMMRFYRQGNNDCRPTAKTFGQLLVTLAKSNHTSKQEMGHRLLHSMQELGLVPNRVILNWYLRICCSQGGAKDKRRDRFFEALETYRSIRASRDGADANSYTSILLGAANLLDSLEERHTWITSIFQDCSEDGHVNQKVLRTFKNVAPADIYEELTSKHPKVDSGDNAIRTNK